MRIRIRRVAVSVVTSVAIYLAAAVLLVAFGTSRPPPVSRLIAGPFASIDPASMPPLRRYRARDGAELTYREYPGDGSRFAVLIHGSAGSSIDMHPLATLLQQHGYTLYVPDLRGHGDNRPHGDVEYLGQLDDDIEDLMKTVAKGAAAPGTLVGFSSGGGFALRIEAEPRIARYFQRVVLLAPYLRYDAPSVRQQAPTEPAGPAATPWAVAYIGRIIGLTMPNRLAVHGLDGLPVVVFAVGEASSVTRTYSWRLQQNFGAHDDYGADIQALPDSTIVLVGGEDSVLLAAALRREFQSRRPGVAVYCVPTVGHSGLVTTPPGLDAIVGAMTGRTDPALFTACR